MSFKRNGGFLGGGGGGGLDANIFSNVCLCFSKKNKSKGKE